MEFIVFKQVVFFEEGMATKYFDQMLAQEMELRKLTSFPRSAVPWYTAPNPLYYGLRGINQDLRNPTRANRHDLYSLEYYRQHFLMPQTLVFPNHESVHPLRRNIKRFYNAKNQLPREKRRNGEKKFYRKDDVNSFKGERRKTYFLTEFERRYQEGWKRNETSYPISRDDRSSSSLAYRNSTFDICSENMMMEQHLHNIKQFLEIRTPLLDRLSVSENLPQTRYIGNENLMQADFEASRHKTSDLEWQDLVDNASKNMNSSQYLASPNFQNNESWYCPEEQQQIVDLLKEVDFRHDRQLERDYLLQHQNDRTCSDNESQTSDSLQKSSSAEENEDSINILLYPGGIPPIQDVVEEEELNKPEYCRKNSSDLFEEFQNIFTGSPEKNIINKLVKTTLKKSQNAEDDEPENVGRIITDDDKNAVKTVLDFDSIDDLTEKASCECTSPKSSSLIPRVTTSSAIENKTSVTVANKQYTTLHETCSFDGSSNDVEMVSHPTALFNNCSGSHNYSVLDESNNSSVVSTKQFATNSGLKKYSEAKNPKSSEVLPIANSVNKDEHVKRDLYLTPSRNDTDSCEGKNNNKYKKYTNKDADLFVQSYHTGDSTGNSREICSNGSLKQKLHKEGAEKQHNSSGCSKNSTTLNKTIVSSLNSSNENKFRKNQNEVRISQEIIKDHSESPSKCSSNKNLTKGECRSSLSEPFLSPKIKQMGYKRISISEIFNNVNTKSNVGYHGAANYHRIAYLNNLNMNVQDLSPSDHLKFILGIGQNREDNKSGYSKIVKDSANNVTLSQSADNLKASCDSIVMPKCRQEQDSPKYPFCKPIHDSMEKGEPEENHLQTPSENKNLDLSVSHKTNDKNKKCAKSNNDSLDLTESNILASELKLTASVQDPVSKQKTKQKRRKANHKKEKSDKGISSAVDFTEKDCNQNHHLQSNTIKDSEKRSNFDQKVTFDEWIKTRNSFHEPEKTNKCLLKVDLGKKQKGELSRPSHSKHYEPRKLIKETEESTDVNGSDLITNFKKNCDETSAAVKCNFNSSSSKNVNSLHPGWKKPIRSIEAFVDHDNSAPNNGMNANNSLQGAYTKSNYSENRTLCSKYIRDQKRGNRSGEYFVALNYFHMSKINENGKIFTSVNPESDFVKSRGDILKDYDSTMLIKDKVSSSENTRRKFKKKRNEPFLDNYEKQPKIGHHSEERNLNSKRISSKKESSGSHNHYERNDAGVTEDSLSYPVREVTMENDTLKSRSTTKNTNPNFKKKTKQASSGKPQTDDTNAFSRNKVFVVDSDPHSLEFRPLTVNTEEKNLRFRNGKAKPIFSSEENVSCKKENFPKNTTHLKSARFGGKLSFASENEIHGSHHTSFNEENKKCVNDEYDSPGGKTSHIKRENALENAMCFASANGNGSVLSEAEPNMHCHETGDYSKYSKSKQHYSRKHYSSWEKKSEAFECNGSHQITEQKKHKYTNQNPDDNNKIKMEINHYRNDLTMKSISFRPKTASYSKIGKDNREFGKITSNDLPIAAKDLNKHYEQSKIASSSDISLRSLKNPSTLRNAPEINFAHFLKYAIDRGYRKTENRKPGLSPFPSKSKAYKMEKSVTSNIDATRNLVLTVSPRVMETYRRNKQALKMNPSLDVHVHIFVSDLFSSFNFLKGIELNLSSVIGENLLHTLPLLLNLLSFLSVIHVPWTHHNLEKMLEKSLTVKEAGNFNPMNLCSGEMMGQIATKEVLKCWDILSSGITKENIYGMQRV